jgi:predicted hydrocarbon binding protein
MSILKDAVDTAFQDENFLKNLGNNVSLHVQKMIKSSIFDIGSGGKAVLYHSGYNLGIQLVDSNICSGSNLREALESIIKISDLFKLGIITIEEITEDAATIASRECPFCVGFPDISETVCYYESGMITGVLDRALKSKFETLEIKCYASGDTVCEYEIKRISRRGNDEYSEGVS